MQELSVTGQLASSSSLQLSGSGVPPSFPQRSDFKQLREACNLRVSLKAHFNFSLFSCLPLTALQGPVNQPGRTYTLVLPPPVLRTVAQLDLSQLLSFLCPLIPLILDTSSYSLLSLYQHSFLSATQYVCLKNEPERRCFVLCPLEFKTLSKQDLEHGC